MKPFAVPYLCCIVCQSDLKLIISEQISTRPDDTPEIVTGALVCKACAKQYPITQGVPRFVEETRSSGIDMETGKRFALAWKQFDRLDECYYQQFFDWIYPVEPRFFNGKVVLEAGCGKGRHAKIVADAGATQVFGVDIGSAVDVAYKNVGHLPNVHIIQADIRWLPFRAIFDFAFSIGVLHHMDEPAEGFRQIVRCLREDGSIAVWVYGRENNWWLIYLVNPIRHLITCKMHPSLLRILSWMLAVLVWLWAKTVARTWKNLTRKFQFLPPLFYQDYLSYIARFDLYEIHHIVFDHLVTPVAHYIDGAEFKEWFTENRLGSPIIRWHNQNSWTGVASHQEEDLKEMRKNISANETSSTQPLAKL